MKKLFLAAAMLLSVSAFSFAQTKASSGQTQTTQHTKKDGTPDKRYKENKTAKDTVVHAKKDGTPDKRYKENKKN
ncbi:hypothetical protein [Pinibacter aurantiacus]|uniref:Uncharacterized protein n=1 Tax=Pinibacter aurantiacus TaxID=2851599 RepID=A0A9E2W4A2_9BACT|nr:hypothetical protein [Pinibacter aurantiacus]MBV4357228.1 hypothetical protein [Pinibacter aurantiacus]